MAATHARGYRLVNGSYYTYPSTRFVPEKLDLFVEEGWYEQRAKLGRLIPEPDTYERFEPSAWNEAVAFYHALFWQVWELMRRYPALSASLASALLAAYLWLLYAAFLAPKRRHEQHPSDEHRQRATDTTTDQPQTQKPQTTATNQSRTKHTKHE